MKIKYFQDTDTLYIEFQASEVAETRDLDENTILDIDIGGNVCAMTMETGLAERVFVYRLAGSEGPEPAAARNPQQRKILRLPG